MISVNLLPDVKQEYLRAKRARTQVISIATLLTIVAAGLTVVLALWVYVGQPVVIATTTDSISDRAKKLSNEPELDKYLTLQNQLNNLDALHNGKTDFSRLMSYLPKLNPQAPNSVTLSNIEVKADDEAGNTLVLKGETANYTALNTFRDTLRTAQLAYKVDGSDTAENLFESIVVTRSTLDKSQSGSPVVSFEISTVYNPNAFLYSVKNPQVVVKDAETTSSVQATPDIFGKSTVKEEGAQ